MLPLCTADIQKKNDSMFDKAFLPFYWSTYTATRQAENLQGIMGALVFLQYLHNFASFRPPDSPHQLPFSPNHPANLPLSAPISLFSPSASR